MNALLVLLLLAATPAFAQISIDEPWARATAPGAKVGVGYMIIRNRSEVLDRIIAATSPLAERIEFHVHIREADVVKMRQRKAFEVPANGSFELKPGGAHLMFVNIKRPFKEGEKVPATLRFDKAGEMAVEFHVGRLASPPDRHGQHSRH